jgi:hypothetical protein
MLQATRQELNNSIGFTRARIGLGGISHGAHTHISSHIWKLKYRGVVGNRHLSKVA